VLPGSWAASGRFGVMGERHRGELADLFKVIAGCRLGRVALFQHLDEIATDHRE